MIIGKRMCRVAGGLGWLALGWLCLATPVGAWPLDSAGRLAKDRSAPSELAPAVPAPNLLAQGGAPAAAPAMGPGGSVDSEPERIARLQRALQTDADRLEELKRQVDDPQSDYARAEAAFKAIDKELEEKKKQVQQAASDGDPMVLRARQMELEELEKQWALVKKEFQLAITQRKAHLESIPTLETKLAKGEQALAQLRGEEPRPAVVPPETPAARGGPTAPAPANPPAAPLNGAAPATPAAPAPATPAVPVFVAGQVPPTGPAPQPVAADPAAPMSAPAAKPEAASVAGKKPDKRVEEAEKVAAKSEADAQKAERDAASLTERLEILRKDIELQRQLRTVATSKMSVIRDQLADLNGQLEKKVAAGESVMEVRQLIRDAENALASAQADSARISDRLDGLQIELSALQSEQVEALQEAEQKRQAAATAQQAVVALQNPFSLDNVISWLAVHGVRIVLVLIILVAVMWGGTLLEGHLVGMIAYRSTRGDDEERENRAKTLVSVMHNALSTVAFGAAGVMILDECGFPVGPILGGAAVVGLAVAFGAQSLIKDYFTGFMVLMEQQYMIGDVVKIGDITGKVERITLRMSILRDLDGFVHFIPHGQVTTVTNLSHEWARAVFDIGIAYKENVDQVIEVLMELARELQFDATFGPMILEDPVMLGVDKFADSAVVIKFMVKTRPLNSWDVKREMHRRIKNKFDELGIEIPFPHQTLYLANPPASWSEA